jgi:hypothetical protein
MDDAVLEEAIGRSPLDQPAAPAASAIPLDRDL